MAADLLIQKLFRLGNGKDILKAMKGNNYSGIAV